MTNEAKGAWPPAVVVVVDEFRGDVLLTVNGKVIDSWWRVSGCEAAANRLRKALAAVSPPPAMSAPEVAPPAATAQASPALDTAREALRRIRHECAGYASSEAGRALAAIAHVPSMAEIAPGAYLSDVQTASHAGLDAWAAGRS